MLYRVLVSSKLESAAEHYSAVLAWKLEQQREHYEDKLAHLRAITSSSDRDRDTSSDSGGISTSDSGGTQVSRCKQILLSLKNEKQKLQRQIEVARERLA